MSVSVSGAPHSLNQGPRGKMSAPKSNQKWLASSIYKPTAPASGGNGGSARGPGRTPTDRSPATGGTGAAPDTGEGGRGARNPSGPEVGTRWVRPAGRSAL